ncbi:transposase [Legionella geestiana]|uniref:Transposase n=1 Tax=Legionella geestiana TaxID=45065 RepID=A0A0W0U3Q9_9GAMM|nr:transposase [Legionella geestiana]STX53145.1 IS3 element protein InsE; DLP12 prophage [Legionella geestiana]
MNNNKSDQKIIRNKYSPQFKDQAVERAAKEGVPQVAKDLGIAEAILYSWRSKKKQGGTTLEHQKLQQAELARLKRECARLAEENVFLKKAAAYFARETE